MSRRAGQCATVALLGSIAGCPPHTSPCPLDAFVVSPSDTDVRWTYGSQSYVTRVPATGLDGCNAQFHGTAADPSQELSLEGALECSAWGAALRVDLRVPGDVRTFPRGERRSVEGTIAYVGACSKDRMCGSLYHDCTASTRPEQMSVVAVDRSGEGSAFRLTLEVAIDTGTVAGQRPSGVACVTTVQMSTTLTVVLTDLDISHNAQMTCEDG